MRRFHVVFSTLLPMRHPLGGFDCLDVNTNYRDELTSYNLGFKQKRSSRPNFPSSEFHCQTPQYSKPSALLQVYTNNTAPLQLKTALENVLSTSSLQIQSQIFICNKPQGTNPTTASLTHTGSDLSKYMSIFTNILPIEDRPTGEDDEHFCAAYVLFWINLQHQTCNEHQVGTFFSVLSGEARKIASQLKCPNVTL